MRLVKLRHWIVVGIAVWGLFVHQALAGGPIAFNEADGKPFPWPFQTAVFVVEGGDLGVFKNPQLKAAVKNAFQSWEDVPTSSLLVADLVDLPNLITAAQLAPFQKDITVADFAPVTCPVLAGEPDDLQRPRFLCDLLKSCVLEQGGRACPSPIIFDNYDDPKDCGPDSTKDTITTEFFGGDNTVLGFTAPFLTIAPVQEVPPDFRNTVVQAFVVINGCFFTQDVINQLKEGGDADGTRFLDSVLTHEFGHFVGLGHSSVNGDIALLNPSITRVSVSQTTRNTLGKLDPLTSVDISAVETMYPINLSDSRQPASQDTPEQDDKFTLSTIYPCTDNTAKKQAGLCKPLAEGTGTISGNVYILQPDTTPGTFALKPAQGVVVVARRIDGSSGENGTEATVLKEAISQVTGNTFAPKRCEGTLLFDTTGDLQADLSLAGVFGPCTDDQQCEDQLNAEDGLIPRLASIVDGSRPGSTTPTVGAFLGRCGFVSAGFTESQPVGDAREGQFTLSGLAPGTYSVQALPVVCPTCGFSSPLRSSLGVVDFVNNIFLPVFFQTSATPLIQSDNNRTLTFFPNPQTGEFYNGPATGCSGTTAPCGNEAAASTDNPFVYTPIVVKANSQVSNVHIFLNTASVEAFTNPGFNFCQIADINTDGKVNEDDILEVSKAQEDFEKKHKIKNPRADINQDNEVTFIDVDLSTDITSLPRPFFNPASGFIGSGTNSELKRGIATFDAICQSAKAGGCEISPPAEDLLDTGKPSAFTCDTAKNIGCKVTGCPE